MDKFRGWVNSELSTPVNHDLHAKAQLWYTGPNSYATVKMWLWDCVAFKSLDLWFFAKDIEATGKNYPNLFSPELLWGGSRCRWASWNRSCRWSPLSWPSRSGSGWGCPRWWWTSAPPSGWPISASPSAKQFKTSRSWLQIQNGKDHTKIRALVTW